MEETTIGVRERRYTQFAHLHSGHSDGIARFGFTHEPPHDSHGRQWSLGLIWARNQDLVAPRREGQLRAFEQSFQGLPNRLVDAVAGHLQVRWYRLRAEADWNSGTGLQPPEGIHDRHPFHLEVRLPGQQSGVFTGLSSGTGRKPAQRERHHNCHQAAGPNFSTVS